MDLKTKKIIAREFLFFIFAHLPHFFLRRDVSIQSKSKKRDSNLYGKFKQNETELNDLVIKIEKDKEMGKGFNQLAKTQEEELRRDRASLLEAKIDLRNKLLSPKNQIRFSVISLLILFGVFFLGGFIFYAFPSHPRRPDHPPAGKRAVLPVPSTFEEA
ncbi:MAG: hypothetical protein IPH04_02665 [Saprospirales bacterium]|nr:hypothetical protein [Saprospirales bacterium]